MPNAQCPLGNVKKTVEPRFLTSILVHLDSYLAALQNFLSPIEFHFSFFSLMK